MAHKRSKSSNNKTRSDDTFDISSESELLRNFIKKQPLTPSLHLEPPKFNLNQIQDLRRFHPAPEPFKRPAGALKRSATQLVIPADKKSTQRARLPSQVAFKAPPHVLVCIRRKQRKQVLFAKKLTGRGSRARKHTRNYWSSVKC
ncbi:MAG: hypothetical protein [Wigfec virus K19_159]|nr:MAG: hypothetical protein [Wigfec virus K19_159]